MRLYTKTPTTFLLILILFLLTFNSYSQEEKLKAMYVEAESYFLFEEYKDALPLYQRILQAEPDNYNISYKIGICYLNDIYQVQKSISYFEKASKNVNPDYKANNFKEKLAPEEVFYYLGNAYRVNNRLQEAIDAYEHFKTILDPAVYDVGLVDDQIESCKVAMDKESKPMYYTSVNQGENINDKFEEINPVVSGDESVMVFVRKLQFYDAVFYSRKVNGKWSEPINLTPSFGVDGNSYCTGISYNGDELFVYRSDNFDGNIYVSKRKNDVWSKLEKLNSNINTKYWESSASLSKDGKTLYFTSNRAGGYGGLDIYKSERTRGEEWGPAINLGPVINSKYNEDTPFLTEDGQTLYFSSLDHSNMGGYDIFYSTKLSDGQWAKPINVGYPLNTTGDDLFFVPVHDGEYAYYSKYDPGDSYGMADIYRLEVFTDLHPRKFILNGIARLEGKVKPDYSKYTATLTNSKTGKMIDQAKLSADGTYTLNALSGDMELQIKGNDINLSSEKLTIPINNPSNTVTHSTTLAVATTPVSTQGTPTVAQEQKELPELNIGTTTYTVNTSEEIPITLELDKNTSLKVETFVDGKLVNTENFDIKRRKFVYLLKPSPGKNLLRFTLTDGNGNTNTQEITVVYTPSAEELAALQKQNQKALADSDKYVGTNSLAAGNLAKFLQSIDLHKMQFQSASELYDYLISHAKENNYSEEEVDKLMSQFLSQRDLNVFYSELYDKSSDSLKSTLDKVDLKDKNIYTASALLDYLFKNARSGRYSADELRDALYKLAAISRSPLDLIELLQSYSSGNLTDVLEKMKKDISTFSDTRAVADYLMNAVKNRECSASELENALKQAAYNMDVNFLYQSLLYISSDSLKHTLLELDLKKQNIHNSKELIAYLLKNAIPGGYTKAEVLNNIEKVRKDPYYYVDMFRKVLVDNATGSLKLFIQEIDIRGLRINTYEDLLDYLIRQSQYHDFNREMVYKLLLDIIGITDVKEFINLLLKYGDDRILAALHAAKTDQFSTPVEVIQYLLSVADQYGYTERDLLRLLLKIMLEKGPVVKETAIKPGWWHQWHNAPMISALALANLIILAVIIIFLMRRKKKRNVNEAKK